MDLHAQSLGRAMLVVRGAMAFMAGVVASNNPSMTADSLVLLMGVWTVVDGAALVRQAYPSTGTTQRAEAQPGLMVLGGVGVLVGAICVVAPGLSANALVWLLAAWFAVRAVAESMGVFALASSRARTFLGLSVLVDVALVVAFVMGSSGSTTNLVLFGGALASAWGALHLGLATTAGKKVTQEAGDRLLAPR